VGLASGKPTDHTETSFINWMPGSMTSRQLVTGALVILTNT
jgi:hypothetical protein